MGRERSTFVDVLVGHSKPSPGRDLLSVSERRFSHWLIGGRKKWRVKGTEMLLKVTVYNRTGRMRRAK